MSQKLVFQNVVGEYLAKYTFEKDQSFEWKHWQMSSKLITTAVNVNVRELFLFHTRFQFLSSNTYYHKPFYWAFKVFNLLWGYHKIYIITNSSWSHCSTCGELRSVSEVRVQIPLMLVLFFCFFSIFPTLLLLTTFTLAHNYISHIKLLVESFTQLIPRCFMIDRNRGLALNEHLLLERCLSCHSWLFLSMTKTQSYIVP